MDHLRIVSPSPPAPMDPDGDLGMIGPSPHMTVLRRVIGRCAPGDEPVLVVGETGTGKELVARALHALSDRAKGPFVAVNAAAIPGSLAASELFGHERGAFTGAAQRHAGLFEQANGGTLFLDEISDLPKDLQAWLLRVIESGEVRALGAERARRVDVRVIAAGHADLAADAGAGWLRHDLYWRLAVLTVRTTPLRERRDDIADLARHFLERRPGRRLELGADAIQVLALHDWPGNVRELRAAIVRAATITTGTTLDAAAVVEAIGQRPDPKDQPVNDNKIRAAMIVARGNVSMAARVLGVARSTLRGRLQALRVDPLLQN